MDARADLPAHRRARRRGARGDGAHVQPRRRDGRRRTAGSSRRRTRAASATRPRLLGSRRDHPPDWLSATKVANADRAIGDVRRTQRGWGRRREGSALVVVLFVLVVRVGVELVVVAVVVTLAELAALGGKLRLQTLEIGAAAAVLQLAGDLRLLGLGPAAPHWLDPLDEPGVPAVNTEMSVHLPAMLAGPPRITCPGPWGRRDQRPGSQNRRSRPISAIRRSASRSAATAGGTPSSAASRKIRRVVSKISVALARARGSE